MESNIYLWRIAHYSHSNGKRHLMFYSYEKSKRKAERIRDIFNRSFKEERGWVAAVHYARIRMSLHHTALCRGYIRTGGDYLEHYCGRFGNGIKKHLSNVETNVGTNGFHLIEYYVES